MFAQTSDTLTVKKEEKVIVVNDSILPKNEYQPLAPAKAAFYSAVLPGLGQAYNKKYWKIPIIYAGMAAGIYFYKQQDDDYNRFRDAYKRRLAGYTDDEFQGISDDRLINAQKSAQKNKGLSVIVTVAFYLLNVVDANVDAHLKQYEVSEDLSLQPNFNFNEFNAKPQYGMSLTYRFK
nr:DUF5683 domain-containing protein [Aequorivita vitellina]